MKPKIYLAINLGAESGRVVPELGIENGKSIWLEEVHHFPNGVTCIIGWGNKISEDAAAAQAATALTK